MLGQGGTKEVTIKALKAGEATFKSEYVRPWLWKGWGQNNQAVQSLTFKVMTYFKTKRVTDVGSHSTPHSAKSIPT